jgi:PAS domain-containing protein
LHTYISIKFPLRDKTGKPYATCGISTDITERKRMDDALRATSAEPGGIWDWNLETARLFWSPQVDLLLGIAPGSGRGTQNDFLALMDREDRDAVSLALRHALEQQRSDLTFEHHIHWPDGTLHRLLWAGHILRDHTGRAVHMMGTVRELTASKGDRH